MSSSTVKPEDPEARIFIAPQGNGGSFSSAPIQGIGAAPVLISGGGGQPNLAMGDAGAALKGRRASPEVKNTA